jgi:A/G-specific adenine glycosylase
MSLASKLLSWYDNHRRDLPWRADPGAVKPAYHVWLSEIMLQQTTVATVIPYFDAFLQRWPTIGELAAAELDEVLHAWQGLGYYARARNLHRCAQVVATDFQGTFPATEAELLKLPGIGPYTAAAIAAIAFDQPASPMDGNIERVVARLRRVETELPAAKKELKPLVRELTPIERPGDFAQAMMDLGATVCTPRNPSCAACPWRTDCQGRIAGVAETLPRKAPRKTRPTRHGVTFWLIRDDGAVYMRRRAEQGLLGGLMEFPGTEWTDRIWGRTRALVHAPADAIWQQLPGRVEHTFTHFHLVLKVMVARLDRANPGYGDWYKVDEFRTIALPTLMKKVANHVLDQDVMSGEKMK